MQIQNYLFFGGRCEEAIHFYEGALGAKIQMLMRFKDSPEPPPPGMLPPGQRQERSEAEGRALYQRMLDFSADLKVRGKLKLSQSLTSQADGTRVQVRAGKRALVDGPFAEAKEMVGGFFLLECDTKEEA